MDTAREAKSQGIATIISYCTNDYRYLGRCIEEAKKFSSQIIIPVCDCFFDGTPENRPLLEHTYAEFSDCEFIEFAFDSNQPYYPAQATPDSEEWPGIWHSTVRTVGVHFVRPTIEWVLFLDCDEIIEGDAFAEWFQSGEHDAFDATRLLSYYYSLRPTWRSQNGFQALALFARRRHLMMTINAHDRSGLYDFISGRKKTLVTKKDYTLFLHHYTWVKSKEECLKKSSCWGDKFKKDWKTLIEQAFSGEEEHKLYLGNEERIRFEEVSVPYFDPLSVSLPKQLMKGQPAHKIDRNTYFQLGIEAELVKSV